MGYTGANIMGDVISEATGLGEQYESIYRMMGYWGSGVNEACKSAREGSKEEIEIARKAYLMTLCHIVEIMCKDFTVEEFKTLISHLGKTTDKAYKRMLKVRTEQLTNREIFDLFIARILPKIIKWGEESQDSTDSWTACRYGPWVNSEINYVGMAKLFINAASKYCPNIDRK